MFKLPQGKREEILEKYSYICVYCFDEADSVDHIIPRSWIVSHIDDNLVAACMWCNTHLSSMTFHSTSPSIALPQKQKYIRDLLQKTKPKKDPRSKCPDCEKYFRPLINGATLLICSKCLEPKSLSVSYPKPKSKPISYPKPKSKLIAATPDAISRISVPYVENKRVEPVKVQIAPPAPLTTQILPTNPKLPKDTLVSVIQATYFLGISRTKMLEMVRTKEVIPEHIGNDWYFESNIINQLAHTSPKF